MNLFHLTNRNHTYESRENQLETKEHPLTEIIRFSIIALTIAIFIRFFVAQPFIVSGASMEDTFHNNEYLIVDQLTYQFNEPERGDVVVFRYPLDLSKFFIKRIIGIPGDTLEFDGTTIRLTNAEYPRGVLLEEPYVSSMKQSVYLTETVGPGEYFVMGDNRDASSDSRMWGILEQDKIVGRALIRLFPFTEAEFMPGAIGSEVPTSASG